MTGILATSQACLAEDNYSQLPPVQIIVCQ